MRAEEGVTVKLEGLSVMVGMPTTRDIPPQTVKALLASFAQCYQMKIPVEMGMIVGNGIVPWARDEVVDLFLRSKHNRLFWIDSDMVWEPEQFVRMIALSKLVPVVGATYPAKRERPTFFVNFEGAVEKNEYGLLEVKGFGLGFTVVQREVIEKLAAKAEKVHDQIADHDMASIFRADRDEKGNRRGEDMAFFADVREAGYKVFLDPETDLGHIGVKTYTGTIRDALVRAQ